MAVDFRPKIGGSGVGKSLATSEIIVRNLQHNGTVVILKFYFKFNMYSCDKIIKTWIPFPDKIWTAFFSSEWTV